MMAKRHPDDTKIPTKNAKAEAARAQLRTTRMRSLNSVAQLREAVRLCLEALGLEYGES